MLPPLVSRSQTYVALFTREQNELGGAYLHGRVPPRVAIEAWESGKSSLLHHVEPSAKVTDKMLRVYVVRNCSLIRLRDPRFDRSATPVKMSLEKKKRRISNSKGYSRAK